MTRQSRTAPKRSALALSGEDRLRHRLNNLGSLVLAYGERAMAAADDAARTRTLLAQMIASVERRLRAVADPDAGDER